LQGVSKKTVKRWKHIDSLLKMFSKRIPRPAWAGLRGASISPENSIISLSLEKPWSFD
jgi:hypothetical protein